MKQQSNQPGQSGEQHSGENSQNSESRQKKEPKIQIPAFGFAEDILKQLEGAAAEIVSDTESIDPNPDQTPDGPDRIYRFADRIQKKQNRNKKEIVDPVGTWVIFRLENEYFGFPVERVREIHRVENITRVPHAPFPVRGVTNLRGSVLPVVDLRTRLELNSKEINTRSRILVVESRKRAIGLLVDSVHEIAHIAESKIMPPPPDVMTEQSYYIQGVCEAGDHLIILLDLDKVLLIFDSKLDDQGGLNAKPGTKVS